MNKIKIILVSIVLIFLLGCSDRGASTRKAEIIPLPQKMELKNGHFEITGKTSILADSQDPEAFMVAEGLKERLSAAVGSSLSIRDLRDRQPNRSIQLQIDETLQKELGKEGYELSVKRSKITITAPHPAGLFYGTQTLYQLLPAAIFSAQAGSDGEETKLTVPCARISDWPSFGWRGMHLDVSRHFFPKEFVRKYIDLIAMHKMNVFHWHLTDDNGWRIQIDRYPLLTEVSAWRADRSGIPWAETLPQQPGEPANYGGFYTKEDIREIVEYARQRFITVVPEIEMPGHTSEVFAAYPEFSCSGKRLTVQTGSYWPITDIFCAGKEETFVFLEDVIDEVAELFPSEFIHIGGDEADKTAWKSCPLCQARIKQEGLSGEDELQSYFVKRIEEYLISKGKRLIGWDEILEGGLAPEATVMSWRGFEGGIEAAMQGHEVIMCPVSHCYFDYYQADPDFQPKAIGGLTTLKKVYSFRPVPEELPPDAHKLILGAQGNLWTEYISTPEHAEYMALPRMTALAEVLWSPEKALKWESFRDRLPQQLKRFDQMNARYSAGSGKVGLRPVYYETEGTYSVELETEMPGTKIFYTLEGDEPGNGSIPYENPVRLDRSVTLKAVAFENGRMLERPAEYVIDWHHAIGKMVEYRKPYSERYPGTGTLPLTDGLRGTLNYNDGLWQGYHGENMDLVIFLGEDTEVGSLSVTFLQDQRRWIFLPEIVKFYYSGNGSDFKIIAPADHEIPLDYADPLTHDFSVMLKDRIKTRYIRVEAVNIGICPDWHPGKGGKAWLFADEIRVN